ncbi:large ribosomal subunit protein mL37-like [Glandiceps talaboti]
MEACGTVRSLLTIPRLCRVQIRHYKPAKIAEIKSRRKRNPSVSVLNARIIGVEPNHEHIDLRQKKPTLQEHPLYKEETCYMFTRNTRLLEGMKQALYLTKSKLMDEDIPPRLQQIAEFVKIDNQEDEVRRTIEKSRIFDDPDIINVPSKRFSFTQLMSWVHLCSRVTPQYPKLLQRSLANDYNLAAPYYRGDAQIHVRGRIGTLITSKFPLLPLATDEEIQETSSHQLESLHPISHTIDLRLCKVYRQDHCNTGFAEGYPYPHANLLLAINENDWLPQHLDTKLTMFAFGNCLVRAKLQYGANNEDTDLETPIVTHAIGTNGRRWSFVTFQLNTLKLRNDDGIRNMVWLSSNQYLYQTITKREQIIEEMNPDVFKKFLACYVDGSISV